MARLIVRNVEDDIVKALEERATRNGRSAEAEHRELLRAALLGERSEELKAVLLNMPDVFEDTDFERKRELPRDIEL